MRTVVRSLSASKLPMETAGSRFCTLAIPKEEPWEGEECTKEPKSALDLVLEGTFGLVTAESRRLERIYNLSRGPNGKYENLIDIVSNKDTLLAAYQRVKSRPGLRIPLLGSKELPLNWLNETRASLLAGGYDFKNYRSRHIIRRFGARATQHSMIDRYTLLLVHLWALRTKRAEIFGGRSEYYMKKEPDTLREFTLDFFLNYSMFSKFKVRQTKPYAPVEDLIVQEAMHMALEKVYEPLLAPTVHGYRLNKGCHTLFEEIRGVKWLGVNWLMEFNFKNIFESLDRDILRSVLGEHIEDDTFVDLILKLFEVTSTTVHDVKYSPKMLKKNPKLENTVIEYKELGIRHTILAPFICHIYMQKVDSEIQRICEEQEQMPVVKKRKTIFHVRANPINVTDELPINVKYARYMDEFVIGVGGSRSVVEKIQSLVLKFLSKDLNLVPDYATYSDISFGSTLFLGMRITAAESTYNPKIEAKRMEKRRRCIFRNMKLRAIRERVWFDRVKRMTLHSWALGLRRISKELPSLEKCRRILEHKSEKMVRDFAVAELDRGNRGWAIEEILNTENAVFYNMSAIGIPEQIVQAHKHLTELLEKHYRYVMKGCREKKVALPNNKSKRFEMVRTYGALPIRLIAPLDTIMSELRYMGMLKPDSHKPDPIPAFLNAPDESIVSYYAAVAYALLVYYRCSDNYIKVKRIVDYQVRWSAIISLAAKHDMTVRKCILEFKRGPQMIKGKDVIASLPSTPSVSRFGTMFYDNIQETILDIILQSSKGAIRDVK